MLRIDDEENPNLLLLFPGGDSSAVGDKMLADANQVDETRLQLETMRKLEAFEKKLFDSGRREECESKHVSIILVNASIWCKITLLRRGNFVVYVFNSRCHS